MKAKRPESLDDVRVLGVEDLAKLLHRTVETVKTDIRRKPESLPPRLRVPNTKRLLWLESDVIAWVEKLRASQL